MNSGRSDGQIAPWEGLPLHPRLLPPCRADLPPSVLRRESHSDGPRRRLLRTFFALPRVPTSILVRHSCTCHLYVLHVLDERCRSEMVADEQGDDLKQEANLSFRANATDLASMLAIGEHIAELTRNIDPDSTVTTTTSRAGIIRYAIRQIGHLVQTPAGRHVLTHAGRKELRMYRRAQQTAFDGWWHWVETCSGWPTTNFLEQLDRPPGDTLCHTCKTLEANEQRHS